MAVMAIKAVTAVLLVINITVAVFVMVAMTERSSVSTYHGNLKHHIEKTYRYLTSVKKKDITTGSKMSDGDTKETTSASLEFLSLLKPVAHFSGLDFENEIKGINNTTVPVRNWANSEGSERTLCYNDMTYQNGSITVPATGIYYITSHVKFYLEDNRKNNNSSQTFRHQIVRYSASSRKQFILFENVVTECREGINDGAHLEYPSLTGGLAQLDAGDHVIVRVSHFDLLKHDRDWHYFDIYFV